MNKTLCQIQLGKQGITDNFISTLKTMFSTHQNVKVCVLKNVENRKKQINEFKDKIVEELGNNYTAKVIGFTIFVKKWRRGKRIR